MRIERGSSDWRNDWVPGEHADFIRGVELGGVNPYANDGDWNYDELTPAPPAFNQELMAWWDVLYSPENDHEARSEAYFKIMDILMDEYGWDADDEDWADFMEWYGSQE